MRIAKHLDYNLQAYQERVGLVNFLDREGYLEKCPPGELSKVANYLLYSRDVDAEVELKEGSKKKISYETLIESTVGERTVQNNQQVSIYKVIKPKIDKEADADIPGMKTLWEAIEWAEERYHYCKDVLDGVRDMDITRKLMPTYQNKYFMREWMISLKREQFILKDMFKPTMNRMGGFASYVKPQDPLGMKIGKHMLCEGEFVIDYGDWRHVYHMLKFYSSIKGKCIDNPYHDFWEIYDFLDEIIEKVRWSPEHKHILIRKIDKVSNEEIAKELTEEFDKSYSVNYISTIWKQHITKRIAKQAGLHWKEKEFKPDGTLATMTKWRICPICGRTLFADDINFGKYKNGTWREVCKDCTYNEKKMREQRREIRNERKRKNGQ